MSKIGRMPIDVKDVTVDVKGADISYKGKNSSGVHELPHFLQADLDGDNLTISMKSPARQNKKFWGLHRALLANKIFGARQDFERHLIIKGLGYKADLSGKKVKFSLGYSHKIDFVLPEGVSMTVDRSGQNLTLKSFDKELLGLTSDRIRSLRKPEPYKGTGIRYSDEVIIRKAGKTKT